MGGNPSFHLVRSAGQNIFPPFPSKSKNPLLPSIHSKSHSFIQERIDQRKMWRTTIQPLIQEPMISLRTIIGGCNFSNSQLMCFIPHLFSFFNGLHLHPFPIILCWIKNWNPLFSTPTPLINGGSIPLEFHCIPPFLPLLIFQYNFSIKVSDLAVPFRPIPLPQIPVPIDARIISAVSSANPMGTHI